MELYHVWLLSLGLLVSAWMIGMFLIWSDTGTDQITLKQEDATNRDRHNENLRTYNYILRTENSDLKIALTANKYYLDELFEENDIKIDYVCSDLHNDVPHMQTVIYLEKESFTLASLKWG